MGCILYKLYNLHFPEYIQQKEKITFLLDLDREQSIALNLNLLVSS